MCYLYSSEQQEVIKKLNILAKHDILKNISNKFLKRSVNTNLPALVCSSVVWVVFSDVGVNSIQCELFIWGHGNRLDNQLGIRVGWFGVILLCTHTHKKRRHHILRYTEKVHLL